MPQALIFHQMSLFPDICPIFIYQHKKYYGSKTIPKTRTWRLSAHFPMKYGKTTGFFR
jgi:hypothetical protein